MARLCPNADCARKYDDSVFFCGECGRITIEEQAPDDIDPRIGEQLGDYLVVARIADGAMGRVYEARHFESRARVAVKVLHPDVARDPVSAERFKREYETTREMDHPHIVKMIDCGTTRDGMAFLTMEYLEGEELGAVIRAHHKVEMARLVRVICQTALGLDYAHSFGLVHRDLKPDNIFLLRVGKELETRGSVREQSEERVRILDFGSVKVQAQVGPKLTAFGTTLGSPYYMSPEQAMGKQDVDHRTDVFALAAILAECLTGKVVFEAGNIAQILMKIVSEPPVLPSQLVADLPASIDAVVDKGLRKDKKQRYQSASELARGFCEALGLSGEVERWANTPLQELRSELARAMPQDGSEPRASTKLGSRQPTATSVPAEGGGPAKRGGTPWVIGIGAVVVVVGVLAALLLR